MPTAIILARPGRRIPVNLYVDRPPRPAGFRGRLPRVNPKADLAVPAPQLRQKRDQLAIRAWTTQIVLHRYPRIVAHLICESLGYATPTCAAQVIADALNNQENWCERIYSVYDRDPVAAVCLAIRNRHGHRGYMAEYLRALPLVCQAVLGEDRCELASWF